MTPRRFAFTLTAALAIGLAFGRIAPRGSAAPQGRPDAPQAATDPLQHFDEAFRHAYGKGRTETLARLGPVIFVDADKLVLHHDGRRDEQVAIPRRYHDLKAVAHMPLAVFSRLDPADEGPIDPTRLDDLRTLRAAIVTVDPILVDRGFTPEQLDRSKVIVKSVLAHIDARLADATFRRADLEAFTRALGPLVLEHASDAVAAQLDGYEAVVRRWREAIPADAWADLHVVVAGPQMPRRRNAAVQYFARLMGQDGESRRLVYAEELYEEPRALALLATHRLDTEIGAAFFGNRDRMLYDLLGDAATEWLNHHLPEGPRP